MSAQVLRRGLHHESHRLVLAQAAIYFQAHAARVEDLVLGIPRWLRMRASGIDVC